MKNLSLLLLIAVPTAINGWTTFGGCTNGITCRNVTANNLTFHCRQAAPTDGLNINGSVMLLHGFPEWSDMYLDVCDFGAYFLVHS